MLKMPPRDGFNPTGNPPYSIRSYSILLRGSASEGNLNGVGADDENGYGLNMASHPCVPYLDSACSIGGAIVFLVATACGVDHLRRGRLLQPGTYPP